MTANNNDSITLDAIGKRSLTNEPNNNGGDKIITRSKRTRKETVTNRKLVTGNRTRKKSCSIDGETSSRKSSTDVKPKKSNTCEVCQKVFQGQNDLKKHFRIHTDERPYPCTYCDKSFRQSGCLKNHIASQHGTNILYTCFYCNKKFPIKERLRLHMRLHSGEKPYKCDMCPKQFARGGQLVHHRTTHKGIRKKFKCMTCPASFSCSVNLKLHIKSHNGIRDYVCNICGKDFIRPDALKKHEICFHKNVKAFQCKICNKTFKGHLPQHMRTHENIKPFGCAECRATFSQRSQLNVHIRVHSGERPYRCPVCWQAFAHSSVLKLHIRKHTGEKPFRCVLCVENLTAFSQLPHLKTHMRAIHNIDRYYLCKKCNNFFKTKLELQQHQMDCEETAVDSVDQKEIIPTDDRLGIEPPFEVTKMRVNIAVLLKKISTEERLKALGFEKRLIDNVLVGALKASGQKYNEDKSLSEADRLKENVQYLLEWLINPSVMSKFREENRSVEDLLDKLANADDFKSTED